MSDEPAITISRRTVRMVRWLVVLTGVGFVAYVAPSMYRELKIEGM